jgi:hypothetical protein
MRKLLLSAIGAMTLVGGATTATAASVIVGPVPAVLTPPSSSVFGAVLTGSPSTSTAINDVFTFTILGGPALTDAQVSTILLNDTQNVNFSSILLDSTFAFTKTSSDPNPETWALLNPVTLGTGTHTISVLGTLLGETGSYSGTINVQVAPVPEPGTWAMMLLGFGAIGLMIRRRRRPALAQIA